MIIVEQISKFLSPLNTNPSVYKGILELVIAKIKNHSLSIRSAEKRGMLNLSSSYHYNCINKLGNIFINGKISLQDFLVGAKSNMSIVDATYLKRE